MGDTYMQCITVYSTGIATSYQVPNILKTRPYDFYERRKESRISLCTIALAIPFPDTHISMGEAATGGCNRIEINKGSVLIRNGISVVYNMRDMYFTNCEMIAKQLAVLVTCSSV
jgi:hypothetical protein